MHVAGSEEVVDNNMYAHGIVHAGYISRKEFLKLSEV